MDEDSVVISVEHTNEISEPQPVATMDIDVFDGLNQAQKEAIVDAITPDNLDFLKNQSVSV